MKLRCLRNNILFVLLQRTNKKGVFIDETKWGFQIVPGTDFQGRDNAAFSNALQEGRWAKVLTVGPECEEIKPGDYICVEPQMWTNAFTYDGIKIRRTDESKVMLISKEKPDVRI